MIQFKRSGNSGELLVDNVGATGASEGYTTATDVNPPFYLGGVIPEKANSVLKNIVRRIFRFILFNFILNTPSITLAFISSYRI